MTRDVNNHATIQCIPNSTNKQMDIGTETEHWSSSPVKNQKKKCFKKHSLARQFVAGNTK